MSDKPCDNCKEVLGKYCVSYQLSCTTCFIIALKQLSDTEKELEELRVKCEKYREALESISKNTCCEPCQEAKNVAREALKDN